MRRGKENIIIGAITDYLESPMPVREIAEKWNTTSMTIYRWVNKYYNKETDTITLEKPKLQDL